MSKNSVLARRSEVGVLTSDLNQRVSQLRPPTSDLRPKIRPFFENPQNCPLTSSFVFNEYIVVLIRTPPPKPSPTTILPLGEHATTINFKGLPDDEDLIAVGTNTRMSRERCQQIIDEVKSILKEL